MIIEVSVLSRFILLPILCITVILSACVNTGSPRTGNIDKEKARNIHLDLGLTYLQRDSREAARRHFQKALTLDADSAAAHNGMAMVFERTGEFVLAEKSFLRAISEDSDYTQTYVSYGRFLSEQKRYQEAYDAFETAAKDIAFKQRPIAIAYLGQMALKLNNLPKAKSSFQHALNLDNNLPLPMIELADIYFDEKNYAESKKLLDQYVDLVGRTPQSLWLGIRIERIFGNKDKEASYALMLRNLHPYSLEYLEYKKAKQQ